MFYLPLDIVCISEMQKCGLKYVIHIPGRDEESGAEAPQVLWKMNSIYLIIRRNKYLLYAPERCVTFGFSSQNRYAPFLNKGALERQLHYKGEKEMRKLSIGLVYVVAVVITFGNAFAQIPSAKK